MPTNADLSGVPLELRLLPIRSYAENIFTYVQMSSNNTTKQNLLLYFYNIYSWLLHRSKTLHQLINVIRCRAKDFINCQLVIVYTQQFLTNMPITIPVSPLCFESNITDAGELHRQRLRSTSRFTSQHKCAVLPGYVVKCRYMSDTRSGNFLTSSITT